MSAPERLRQRATAALDLGRFEEGVKLAREAIAADPHEANGFAILARAQLGLGAGKEAEASAREGLAHAAEREWLHRLLAIALRLQQKHGPAAEAINKAIELDPYSELAHLELGRIRLRQKRYKEAIAAAQASLALNPESGTAHELLGETYLGQGRWAECERAYRDALKRSPNDATSLNNLGVALERQGRLTDAALAYKAFTGQAEVTAGSAEIIVTAAGNPATVNEARVAFDRQKEIEYSIASITSKDLQITKENDKVVVLADPTLKVAKTNTLKATDRILKVGLPGGLFALLMVAQGFSAVGRGAAHIEGRSPGAQLLVLLGGLALGAVFLLAFWLRHRRRARGEAELRAIDPQLLEIYRTLKADKRL